MVLLNKVALITGSTSGMGKSIATLFAKEGAKLIIHGRDKIKGERTCNELRKNGSEVFFYDGDISDPVVNKNLVERACEHFGKLDIVVANAGMLGLGSVTTVDVPVFRRTMEVNLISVFYLSRYAIPEMIKNGGGSIIVNGSIAAFKSFPNHPAYCASKAGVVALTKQIALDYGPAIRANVVCPGPVDTPLIWHSASAFPDPAKAVEIAGNKTAMKRLGLPEDIANLVLFLASEKASWMTGSVITIDGGVTIT